MSTDTDDAYRSVSRPPANRRNAEMSAIGWAIFTGLLVLVVPLLPFLAVVWAIGKLRDYGT